MEAIFIYIAKVNIALAVFYLLYVLLFRKDTFIRLRRYYFLSAMVFSLVYPLFTVAALSNLIDLKPKTEEMQTSISIGELTMEYIVDDVEDASTPIDWAVVARNILLVGILFFSLRFVWQLYSILRIKSHSEKKTLFGYLFYHLRDEITPFSFFKWIFIHQETHTEKELKQILIHEQTHVKQWHSLDILLVEMLRILFWWNPTVWLMKRDIAINLEYLADQAVLQEGVQTADYQYHLLQLTYQDTAVQIVNNYNVSQLKQRIIMMNKNKSPMRKLAKYLSVLPLILLLITANSVYAQAIGTQEPLKQAVPPPPPQKKASKSDEVFIVVDELPEFPGGTKELMHWLGENIQYPKEAQEKRIEGRVIVNFTVEKDGSISDAKIVRGQNPILDAEALRVVPLMPNWKPGELKNEIIRVMYTLPIVFRLSAEDKEQKSSSSVIGFASSDKKGENEIFVLGNGSKKDGSELFDGKKPLIIVDDVKMKKDFDINSITPENIESISVLKDKTAIEKYGEEGKDGVILVTLKKKAIVPEINDSKSNNNTHKGADEIFVVVEKQPEFPGGTQALMNFIGENVRYPVEAQKNGIQGRVIVNFIVNKDGSLSDLKVVRGQDPSLDAEAIRVISTMPKWKPGMQRGEAVNVRFTLPIVFRLQGDEGVESEAMNKLKEKGPVSVTDMKNDVNDKAFYKFIGENVRYPVIAQENGIMGLSKATYDVNAKGEVSNVKTTESVYPSLDAELIRIIKLMPKDIALMKSGGKAASNVEISALFRLQDESTVPPPPVKSDIVVVGYGKPAKK